MRRADPRAASDSPNSDARELPEEDLAVVTCLGVNLLAVLDLAHSRPPNSTHRPDAETIASATQSVSSSATVIASLGDTALGQPTVPTAAKLSAA